MQLLCSDCGLSKDEEEFHRANGRYPKRNGRGYLCKPCKIIKTSAYQKKNYEKWRKYRSDYTRNRRAFYAFGEYDQKLVEQNYQCAICGTTEPGGKGQFHADHDHKRKKSRGLLCFACNSGLGFFRDNADFLESAVEYLKKHSDSADNSQ